MAKGLVIPLNDAWVLAESGPMRLLVAAWDGGKPLLESAQRGGEWACGLLKELAPFQVIIKKKAPRLSADGNLPQVVKEMVGAVQRVGDEDLTPLSAVAGTISDLVAEHTFSQGVSKVIVDNGGDVAIRMAPEEVVRVGIRLDVTCPEISYCLQLTGGMGVGGVTTSGLGGRSFTKGVAQAAVVLGPSASVADAASTSVANATAIDSPRVKRIRADEIDPDTDLRGEEVTLEVEKLTSHEVDEALSRGMGKAQHLMDKGVILGALICVQGRVVWDQGIKGFLSPLTQNLFDKEG
ncbi:MAG: hypothetical protein JRI46_00740 [Deltaproteobacteria bacterium]|nr:hypothetical protein [Deltaproteobacteria bacterium]